MTQLYILEKYSFISLDITNQLMSIKFGQPPVFLYESWKILSSLVDLWLISSFFFLLILFSLPYLGQEGVILQVQLNLFKPVWEGQFIPWVQIIPYCFWWMFNTKLFAISFLLSIGYLQILILFIYLIFFLNFCFAESLIIFQVSISNVPGWWVLYLI